MAGLMSRASLVVKSKFSKLLDRAEDPGETLDYSYEKQLELLQNVKRGIADVVTAKKRLELQETQLQQSVVKLDSQAREAVAAGDDQGAVLRRRGAGTDRRGRDRDRRADGGHRPGHPAREGQDRADAGARVGDRRADHLWRARGLHLRPDGARPPARRDRVAVAGRQGARADEVRARQGRREEGAAAVIVRVMGDAQY